MAPLPSEAQSWACWSRNSHLRDWTSDLFFSWPRALVWHALKPVHRCHYCIHLCFVLTPTPFLGLAEPRWMVFLPVLYVPKGMSAHTLVVFSFAWAAQGGQDERPPSVIEFGYLYGRHRDLAHGGGDRCYRGFSAKSHWYLLVQSVSLWGLCILRPRFVLRNTLPLRIGCRLPQ